MTFAPKKTANRIKMQTKMSAWTPLNHQLSNDNVFEERRDLLGKWFDKWTDSQRKRVLQDFFSRCTLGQLRFLRAKLSSQVPEEALDFTTVFPRVLSLYVFSFLDPRSLCRCAQVAWRWKALVELDQLWLPKCLRLGWCINFTPTPFEQGVWKRHYIQTVQELHISKPKVRASTPLQVFSFQVQTPSEPEFVVPEVKAINSKEAELSEPSGRREQRGRSAGGRGSGIPAKGLPPWRGSDKHPTDTLRFNYLENCDPIEQARQLQAKSKVTVKFTKEENSKRKPLSDSAYKLRKAKSLMFLSLDVNQGRQRQMRPAWATNHSAEYPVTKATAKSLAQMAQWNAGIPPGPVRLAVPRMSEGGLRASQRSQRSTPTVPLFEVHPWKPPPSDLGSDDE
ncbi:hypothetical protein AGOR_G00087540 [Albula goreensis]|uniref:F-box domain-containing protein n=1 Tax=Albula goreensis TaxID=1534307 RepID=A0A8T3DKU5_9TELE|nr:hypothetical protein AGOR_G00087540 [Albula goreensis]